MKKRNKTRSRILEEVHETAKGLHKIGLIDAMKMQEFDSYLPRPARSQNHRDVRTLKEKIKLSENYDHKQLRKDPDK